MISYQKHPQKAPIVLLQCMNNTHSRAQGLPPDALLYQQCSRIIHTYSPHPVASPLASEGCAGRESVCLMAAGQGQRVIALRDYLYLALENPIAVFTVYISGYECRFYLNTDFNTLVCSINALSVKDVLATWFGNESFLLLTPCVQRDSAARRFGFQSHRGIF